MQPRVTIAGESFLQVIKTKLRSYPEENRQTAHVNALQNGN